MGFLRDDYLDVGEFKHEIEFAFKKFLTTEERANTDLVLSLKRDIKSCYFKYLTTPQEYFLFNFRTSSNEKRESFLSDKVRLRLLLKNVGEEKFVNDLCDKFNFFKLTKSFFKRRVILFDEHIAKDEFVHFALDVGKLFIKPIASSFGRGARLVNIFEEKEAIDLFVELSDSHKVYIVEEFIQQCAEFSLLNESSCNTIRIPTYLTEDGFFISTPVMRIGRKGSIVDNAGSGGIIVLVDLETGILGPLGVDEAGNHFTCHPDSGIIFSGYSIPKWSELLSTVESVHRTQMPTHIYIGWDFTLTASGWVLIEANWGQFLNQYIENKGIKDEFMKYINMNPYKKTE